MTPLRQMAEIIPDNRKWLDFNIEGNGEPPLKMKILKICFFHVRKGPNIGSEPNFHDHTTSNVEDYPGQPKPKFKCKVTTRQQHISVLGTGTHLVLYI